MLWAGRRSEKALRREWRKRMEEVQANIFRAVDGPSDTEEPRVAPRVGTSRRASPMGTLTETTYESTYDSESKTYIPNDIYVVELTRVSEPQVSDPKYKKKADDPDTFFVFVDFTVVQTVDGDTEFAGKMFDDTAGYRLTKGPKGPSKLRTWVEAFLGRELEPKEPVDFNALGAQKLRARVTVDTKENGRNKVTSVAPLKRKAAAANGTARVKAADDDEVPF